MSGQRLHEGDVAVIRDVQRKRRFILEREIGRVETPFMGELREALIPVVD
jgi:hypothetical protein